jgi:DNA anti-recombination protein RmuC
MDDKLQRLQALKEQRSQLDQQIKALAGEMASELSVALHGQRKQRKPRQPKLALTK